MLPTKKLMSAIGGLAMMAMPVSAMAADHHHNWNHNFGNEQFVHSQNFARRPAAAQNQFVHKPLRNPIGRDQEQPGLDWGRGLAFGSHPNYARNQSNRQNWAYPPYNNGNWMANSYREWDVPPSGNFNAGLPQINPYAPPPGQFAFNQTNWPERSNCTNGYGNRYGYANPCLGSCGYGNSFLGSCGYGNSFLGGGLMALRDRLLQERAGAYQQLAIRERNGDHNGAHHLQNAIQSLNQQLVRVNTSINHRS
jgi:hypothetical protein